MANKPLNDLVHYVASALMELKMKIRIDFDYQDEANYFYVHVPDNNYRGEVWHYIIACQGIKSVSKLMFCVEPASCKGESFPYININDTKLMRAEEEFNVNLDIDTPIKVSNTNLHLGGVSHMEANLVHAIKKLESAASLISKKTFSGQNNFLVPMIVTNANIIVKSDQCSDLEKEKHWIIYGINNFSRSSPKNYTNIPYVVVVNAKYLTDCMESHDFKYNSKK